MCREDGAIADIRHLALGGLGDIVAKGMGFTFFVEDGVVEQLEDGVGVAYTHEGTFGDLEGWVEVVGNLFVGGVDKGGGDDTGHDFF